MQTNETVQGYIEVLRWLIGPGAGVAVQAVMNWLIAELDSDGRKPSPKTARRLTYLVSIVAPTVLYLVLAWLTSHYEPVEHVVAILAAFGVATGIHGETKLKTGAEERVDALLAVPDAVSANVVSKDAVIAPPVVWEDGEEVR